MGREKCYNNKLSNLKRVYLIKLEHTNIYYLLFSSHISVIQHRCLKMFLSDVSNNTLSIMQCNCKICFNCINVIVFSSIVCFRVASFFLLKTMNCDGIRCEQINHQDYHLRLSSKVWANGEQKNSHLIE